jgi:hypothetical protein
MLDYVTLGIPSSCLKVIHSSCSHGLSFVLENRHIFFFLFFITKGIFLIEQATILIKNISKILEN